MQTLLAYIRKSVIDNPNTPSPAKQRHVIEHWNETNGPWPLEWFQDLDKSGRTEDRPGWQRLLQRLPDPDVLGVIIYDYTKTHRDTIGYLTFYDTYIASHNKMLIDTSDPNLNLETPEGRAVGSVKAVFAELHARKTSDEMKRTVAYLTQVKKRHWGQTPFACDRHPRTKHLIPSAKIYYYHPATNTTLPDDGETRPPPGYEPRRYFDALRRIFEIYAQGEHSYNDVAVRLNGSGWRMWERNMIDPTFFHRMTIWSILQRWQLYAGNFNDGSEAGHEPLLPPELCQRVGGILRRRSRIRNPGGSKEKYEVYLLSGLIFCGQCDQSLTGMTTKDKYRYRYYRHTYNRNGCPEKSVKLETVEREVLDMLQMLTGHLAIRQAQGADLLREFKRLTAPDNEHAQHILAEHQAERERLIDLRVSGVISREQFDSRNGPLQTEIERLEEQLAQVRPILPEAEINQILGALAAVGDNLREFEPKLLRELVHSTFERLEVRERKLSGAIPQAWARPFFDLL